MRLHHSNPAEFTSEIDIEQMQRLGLLAFPDAGAGVSTGAGTMVGRNENLAVSHICYRRSDDCLYTVAHKEEIQNLESSQGVTTTTSTVELHASATSSQSMEKRVQTSLVYRWDIGSIRDAEYGLHEEEIDIPFSMPHDCPRIPGLSLGALPDGDTFAAVCGGNSATKLFLVDKRASSASVRTEPEEAVTSEATLVTGAPLAKKEQVPCTTKIGTARMQPVPVPAKLVVLEVAERKPPSPPTSRSAECTPSKKSSATSIRATSSGPQIIGLETVRPAASNMTSSAVQRE